MESHIARLEEKADRTQADISDIKIDLRGIRGDVKEADQRLTGKIDDVKASVVSLSLEIKDLASALANLEARLLWKFTAVFIGTTGTLLGVMAKGFGWI